MKNIFLLCMIVLGLLALPPANATTVNITALGDTYVTEAAPSSPQGAGTDMYVGHFPSAGYLSYGLVFFDVSQIPTGSIIISANIHLYEHSGGNVGYVQAIHRVTASWDESTATWNTQPSIDNTVLASTGGLASPGWMFWNVTATVDSFSRSGINNYGFLLNEASANTSALDYYTKEYGSYAPYIEIEYHPAPVITSNTISPTIAYPASTLASSVTATDAESNPISYSYLWYKDGSSLGITTQNLAPPLSVGSVYKVLVTPNNGYVSGTANYCNSITIQATGSNNYIPSTPVLSAITTGNFYVNTSWNPGTPVDSTITSNYGTVAAAKLLASVGSGWKQKYGEAITTVGAVDVGKVTFHLLKHNSPTGTAVVSIYASSGTVGTNAVGINGALATSNGFDVATLSGSYQNITFTFGNTYHLSANMDYVIIIEYGGGDATNYIVAGATTDTYAGNIASYDGSSWAAETAFDMIFDIRSLGGNTDTYSLNVNGTWYNGTSSNFRNTTLSPHGWQNITVFAYNSTGSGTSSVSSISNNTQIPNNVPVVQNITFIPNSVTANQNISISMNAIDADNTDIIAKHFRWYKNGILNSSWNDITTLNYTGNYTTNDSIYVLGYVNDGYINSSSMNSSTTVVGYPNNPPILSGISLKPSTKKYNKTILINTTSNITDSESSSIQLQTYFYNGSSKAYLGNSSWIAPPANISVQVTIPWNDGLTHTIYAVALDNGNANHTINTNLTSSEVSAIFTSDITAPTVITASISASSITVGGTITISAQLNGQGANISTAMVNVELPDTSVAYWIMTCEIGATPNCTRNYAATVEAGTYYITNFEITDDSGNIGTVTSNTSFTTAAAVTYPSSGGTSGGGGSPAVSTPAPTATQAPQIPQILFTNITDVRSVKDMQAIGDCLSSTMMLSNSCSASTITIISDPANWWVVAGAYIIAILTLLLLAIIEQRSRSWLIDTALYGTISIMLVLGGALLGFNMFIANYIMDSPLPGYMTASFGIWALAITLIGDHFSYATRMAKTLKESGRSTSWVWSK